MKGYSLGEIALFSGSETMLPQFPQFGAVVGYAINIVVTLLVAYIIVRLINTLIGRFESTRRVKPSGTAILRTIISSAVYAIAVLVILSTFIIPMEVALLIGAILTVSFLLSIRDILANIAAYFGLSTMLPSRKGVILNIRDIRGNYVGRNILFTEVHTSEGLVVYVPNVVFLKDSSSLHSGRTLTKTSIVVKVDGSANVEKAEEVMVKLLANYKEATKPPNPSVFISDIRREYTEFTIHVHVTNPHKTEFISSDLRKQIREALESAKIMLY